MFALWYLSLAVDEMRKHFGWTFLDIFYGKSAKAINSVPKNSSDTKATTILPSPQSLKTSIVTAVTATTTTTTTPPPPIQPLQTSFNKEITTISIAKPKLNEVEANLSINQTINKPIINVKEKPLVTPEVPQIPSTMPSTKPAGTTTATITLKPRTTTNASTCETNQSNINPLKSDNKSAMSLTNSINKMITSEKIPINNNKSIIPEKEKQTNRNDYKNVSGSKVNAKARNRNMLASLEEDFDNLASLNNGNKYKDIANDQNAKIKDMRSATTNFLNNEVNSVKKLDMSLSKEKTTMVDAAVLTKLEEGYAKLAASNSKSLLKKYLTKEIFDNLKNKKTPTFGSTLLDCIQSGLENHDSGVGIYAPDAEAYTVFADIFDPIIEDYHGGFKKTDKHPAKDFGNVACFTNLDPNNEYVISTRVRCGRSLQGYPFNPCLTEAQYKEMECKVASTLACLEGELKGKFYPLTGMDKAVQQQLIDDHFLFKEGDRFLQAANASRFWPTGRGIYHNDNKTFLVWCNEEDHLRIISMQMGGDLGEVYRRLVTAVNEIEKRLPFSHDNRLGFLTFCPTNLGTTIRASVHIKVPKLAANKAKLEEVAAKYHLQVRGTRGEHTEAEGGVYDISNKRRMGLTEFQAVKEMNDGIAELIKLEKSM